MKARHLTERREPAKGRRFAWGRVHPAGGDAATWRLFRRCISGRVLTLQCTFSHSAHRTMIAIEQRMLRARLLVAADRIDLTHLGLTP